MITFQTFLDMEDTELVGYIPIPSDGLRHHQRAALAFWTYQATSLKYTTFIVFGKVGIGKTRLVLDLLKVLSSKSCLYVSGRAIGVISTRDEIQKHRGDCLVQTIEGASDYPSSGYEFSITCYGTIGRSSSYCIDYVTNTKTGKKRVKVSLAKIKKFVSTIQPDVLVLDEAHLIGNYKTDWYKILYHISSMVKYTIIMTGTPTTARMDDGTRKLVVETLFPILQLFDREKHSNFHDFLKMYHFQCTVDKYNRKKYTTQSPALWNEIKRIAVIYSDKTPAKGNSIVTIFDLTGKQQEIIRDLRREKRFTSVKQVYSGFYYSSEGNPVFLPSKKVKLLEEIIRVFRISEEKLIISYEFIASMRIITELLDRLEIEYAAITAETSLKEKSDALIKFQHTTNILVLSTGVGSMSANLQYCHNLLLYDLPSNFQSYLQLKGRLLRMGQEKTVNFFYLVSKGEVEYLSELGSSEVKTYEALYGKSK